MEWHVKVGRAVEGNRWSNQHSTKFHFEVVFMVKRSVEAMQRLSVLLLFFPDMVTWKSQHPI